MLSCWLLVRPLTSWMRPVRACVCANLPFCRRRRRRHSRNSRRSWARRTAWIAVVGWMVPGDGVDVFLVEFLWCPFFCSVQEEHVFQSVRSDQTVFFQNSLKEALRIAHLACRKRLSETKTTSWLVSWRQRTSETIPLFDSVHLQISPKLCILNFHDVLALWSNMIHGPIWSLWSWCTELAAWWRLRQVVGSDWQEANLRTKIKSIISESKAAIVDEDEEEASIAWRFRLQSASFHAPKGCCHGEHRNNTSNSLGSSSLGFERLRPIHIWLQVHTFDISAFTKIKYVYSKGEWRENTTIFQSHGFLLIFHSTNPFQPPASINLPYCRMSQTKSLESRSWSLRCHPRVLPPWKFKLTFDILWLWFNDNEKNDNEKYYI